jgi:hypothetical protein
VIASRFLCFFLNLLRVDNAQWLLNEQTRFKIMNLPFLRQVDIHTTDFAFGVKIGSLQFLVLRHRETRRVVCGDHIEHKFDTNVEAVKACLSTVHSALYGGEEASR